MASSVLPADRNAYRGTALLVTEIILTLVAVLTTFTRLGLRKLNRQLGWDDATISIAMVSYPGLRAHVKNPEAISVTYPNPKR